MLNSLYHHFSTLDSTNTLAVAMAEQGAEHGTVIHADRQTCGRGRGDRTFLSPIGGLYFSLILRPDIEFSVLSLTTLAAGVGLCRGIKKATGGQAQLKWPNDLYVKEKKIAGMLIESGPVRKGDQVDFIVLGVGINVTTQSKHFPAELRTKITTLAKVVGKEFNPADLLPTLIQELVAAIMLGLNRENRADLLAEWRNLDYLRGRSLQYIC
ncbi:MAG: biotin--[acetyl-CoA-carboxylase] ligase, partial [Candidatus Electrothrix sp. AR3]|nr:biotin--[acetyl-CoA-carboxylase] ligase [Candidatus Electrothrix sp. AR3]